MLPGLAAGWSLLFVRMAGDLTASAMLAGTSNPVAGFRILEIYQGAFLRRPRRALDRADADHAGRDPGGQPVHPTARGLPRHGGERVNKVRRRPGDHARRAGRAPPIDEQGGSRADQRGAAAEPLGRPRRDGAERRDVVRVRGLQKQFRRAGGAIVPAIDDVSLDVAEGEFVVLLGPSGCGKTTLLRSIAGLERPDAGEIDIHGRTVYSSASWREPPAGAPRRQHDLPVLRAVAAHVGLRERRLPAALPPGRPRPRPRRRANRALEMVGIADLGRGSTRAT